MTRTVAWSPSHILFSHVCAIRVRSQGLHGSDVPLCDIWKHWKVGPCSTAVESVAQSSCVILHSDVLVTI